MPPTPRKKLDLIDQRITRMSNVANLLIDLHDNNFTSLWIESHQIDDHFYQRVVINRNELSSDDMKLLNEIADVHDATLQLIILRWDQVEHTRLALWPSRD